MKDISLHILDIAQNAIHAGASLVQLKIEENPDTDRFILEINDNGTGMPKEILAKLEDPFFTTGNKKTGLGIPLLKQHAEMAEGNLKVESTPGIGTKVTASFSYSHIDRQPLGNMAVTLVTLIRSNPGIDFSYQHRYKEKLFEFDTQVIKNELQGIKITSKEIIVFIRSMISENLGEIYM